MRKTCTESYRLQLISLDVALCCQRLPSLADPRWHTYDAGHFTPSPPRTCIYHTGQITVQLIPFGACT
ncbi:hypothetical protein K443DRAFT_672037 [Laccaria amethystina LaAM-08-1]|uniref:Uncharacterized protein n=1 Tax=Laccaria amethystina LaAM-08-1 TaxID=1095629 RepID=A0A0C9XVE7_9AGAR|nr:hypothetical protein K443DRAFT_672037 [Laccaria amethystina LaAM-08-1]